MGELDLVGVVEELVLPVHRRHSAADPDLALCLLDHLDHPLGDDDPHESDSRVVLVGVRIEEFNLMSLDFPSILPGNAILPVLYELQRGAIATELVPDGDGSDLRKVEVPASMKGVAVHDKFFAGDEINDELSGVVVRRDHHNLTPLNPGSKSPGTGKTFFGLFIVMKNVSLEPGSEFGQICLRKGFARSTLSLAVSNGFDNDSLPHLTVLVGGGGYLRSTFFPNYWWRDSRIEIRRQLPMFFFHSTVVLWRENHIMFINIYLYAIEGLATIASGKTAVIRA